MLTEQDLREEALTQFANLTRHKQSPQDLDSQFQFFLDTDSGNAAINMKFGKRACGLAFPKGDLELPMKEFSEKYLIEAAHLLLGSI